MTPDERKKLFDDFHEWEKRNQDEIRALADERDAIQDKITALAKEHGRRQSELLAIVRGEAKAAK